jgi:hemerythrin-like domain-containing protein
MPISIGRKPDSDFSNPLGMLSDCHRRIERFLNVILTVTEQARGGELSADQHQALDTAVRYFRTSGPRHTEDEEDSLFPRMRRCGTERGRDALAGLDALRSDHLVAERQHSVVDDLARRWLSGGRLADEEVRALESALARLRDIYTVHIACEDREVFPLAAEILSEEDIREIGQEMALRRQMPF